MQIFVPETDFRACAQALDLRRLRSQINEALVILRTLRGESTAWQHHPAVKAWRGCAAGVYLYREACRAEYAERTGGVWGADVPPPFEFDLFCQDDSVAYTDGILPWWWGIDAVHSSHRAVLLGKWYEAGYPRVFSDSTPPLLMTRWTETPAVRVDGKWPYVWPGEREAK